jgi:peroxiredoxin
MALSTGDSAPAINLFDDEMKAFSLEEARADHNVVLLFFPTAFSSFCTTELNTVGSDYQHYQDLGAEVVGISTDSPFALAEFKKANGFPFRLLSDHNGEVSEAYGAKYDNDFTSMNLDRISKRAAFVVRKDGTIAYAEVLESAGDQPSFDNILSALEAERG